MEFAQLRLALAWIDGLPTGTVATVQAPDTELRFSGWLELAQAIRALSG